MAWLLDICPPEYRSYPVLRRHAVVLAWLAGWHVDACEQGVRRALSRARGDLGELTSPETLEGSVETLQAESARLTAQRRAVGLVAEALQGRRFVPRL